MSDRFHVTYELTLDPGENPEKHIRALQLEQSAELPEKVVHSLGMQHVMGSVSHIEQQDEHRTRVTIGWPSQNHGNEITQFLNVLFGNISLKQGIAIIDIRWEDVSTSAGLFGGPAMGITRIRKNWGVNDRALSCTALKPMGLSTRELAELTYQFALGGIDIIKDDHGLANQVTAPFAERVRQCVNAVDRAAQKTGRRSRYFPNITTEPQRVTERYEMAAELGADGVLFAPMLSGPALMHHLARSSTELPIMAHPAFSGSLIAHGVGETEFDFPEAARHGSGRPLAYRHSNHGFEPGLLYGALFRALGADFLIYPNTGGRFSFSRKVCEAINREARRSDLPFAPSFPTPAGGMQRENMSFWLENYGKDTVFLIGGSLYEDPLGIEEAAKTVASILNR